MGDLFGVKKHRHVSWKNRIVFNVFALVASALFAGQALAFDVDLFGNPLSIKGYINQSLQFGISGDKYTTMAGFQQSATNALVELEYYPADDLKIFTSGYFWHDWAYIALAENDTWKDKLFDKSRSELSLRNDYEDYLKECHVTWTPAGFNFRLGKQIVAWGRMDGTRIMDQINPKDARLGPSDVEFETTIIPIWLAKMEYYPQYTPPFLDEFGLEFIFNPNADFIPDKNPGPGNYVNGIWATDNPIDQLNGRSGALLTDYEEPEKWKGGHEYALRLKGTLPDATYFTLNYFKGIDDNPVNMSDSSRIGGPIDALGGANIPSLNGTPYYDDQGRQIIEPYLKGYYPHKEFAGFTFARDFESLYIKSLGGVAPLVRGEFIYEFNSSFTFNDNSNPFAPFAKFEKHDAIYWGLGVEWKFKWNLLNPRRYFTLQPQFTHRHIFDYPDDPGTYLNDTKGSVTAEDWYNIFVMLRTQYLHDKLTPMIVYMRDIHADVTNVARGSVKYDMWLFKLSYEPNHIWTYKMQVTMLENDGWDKLRGMAHKDNVSFTVQYQF